MEGNYSLLRYIYLWMEYYIKDILSKIKKIFNGDYVKVYLIMFFKIY